MMLDADEAGGSMGRVRQSAVSRPKPHPKLVFYNCLALYHAAKRRSVGVCMCLNVSRYDLLRTCPWTCTWTCTWTWTCNGTRCNHLTGKIILHGGAHAVAAAAQLWREATAAPAKWRHICKLLTATEKRSRTAFAGQSARPGLEPKSHPSSVGCGSLPCEVVTQWRSCKT